MINYKIIDNFLNEKDFENISKEIMSYYFPWYFSPFVANEKHTSGEDFYFTHLIINDQIVRSDIIKFFAPILEKIKYEKLIRIKANLYPNLNKIINNAPHIDYDFSHQGMIFYLNTNNGFTVLEDGTKIESIANRALFFDSSKPHHSTHCTDQKARFNINFNYI